jgi:cytochrome c-type biogenesis protein CcmH/NrfG
MRRSFLLSFVVVFLVSCCSLFADPTGSVRGTVKDPSGNPIEKVTITIEAHGSIPQKFTVQTNKKGEYSQIGIRPADFRITPSKEGYVSVDGFVELHIAPGDRPAKADFIMQPQAAQAPAAEKKEEQPAHIKSAQEGTKLLNEGKYNEAIAEFQKVLQADPNISEVHYNMGVAYERLKQAADAQTQFKEAIRLNPDFGDAYLSLGNSYLAEGKSDFAITALTKATQLMPQNYDAFYNLGAAAANQMKYADAEAAFRKATELKPNEPVAHYQLGMALYGQSKGPEAKAEFQKYLELNPNAADRKDVEDLMNSL